MSKKPFKFTTYEKLTLLSKERLIKIKNSVEELSLSEQTLSPIQHRALGSYLREVKRKEIEFEQNLLKVLENVSAEDYSEAQLSIDQNEILDLCISIESCIEALLPNNESSPTFEDGFKSGPLHQQIVTNVRLPKLDLKHFDGNPLTWVSFINLFDTTIHNNAQLSNVSKFQYLLSILSGEPLTLIKSLTISNANYEVAYEILKNRYHSPRRLTTLHINEILDLSNISFTSPKQMRMFVNNFYEHTEALKALNIDVTVENPLLSVILLRKLDTELRKKLESYRSTHLNQSSNMSQSLPNVKDIIKFLNEECVHNEDANLHNTSVMKQNSTLLSHNPTKPSLFKKPQGFSRNISMFVSSNDQKVSSALKGSQTFPCFVCKQSGHKVYGCSLFLSKSPEERFTIVKNNNRCVSCLGNHEKRKCESRGTCAKCYKNHHSTLHFENRFQLQEPVKVTQLPVDCGNFTQTPAKGEKVVSMTSNLPKENLITSLTTVLLGTFLVKLTSANGNTHVFRALLDSGSMCNFISERAAQLLNVPRIHSPHTIMGLSQISTHTKGLSYLNICTLSGQVVASQHPFFILDKISLDLPRARISPEVLEMVKPYTLADPSFHLPGGIDVLIGGDIFPHILTQENYNLGSNMPHIMGTIFGFVIIGQSPCLSESGLQMSMSTLLSTTDSDLHASLQKFWSQEEPPSFSNKSVEESLCDEHFSQTHTRDETGRYCIKLPFKQNMTPIGQSRQAAVNRFMSLEKKFQTKPNFKELYIDFMNDYLSAGHMMKTDNPDLTLPHYFLPHHGVLKESSSTTKLRTVFDASSKSSTGVSLNDILLTGKKLQTNICDILLHFRTHNIVFCCDIRQMYRQIKVSPEDQMYQLILWRENPSLPLSTYKLTTVTYGMNCSPYLAIRTLAQLAKDEGDSFPAAAQVLSSHTYVDDIITGADTEEQAMNLQSQLISLLKRGGFELRKWYSNSTKLLKTLPKEHLETPVFLQAFEHPLFSILGLHWSPINDSFTYNLNFPSHSATKRSILSIIAQIYDPCGFLSPVTMWAKCFMQILWTQRIDWDEPISSELADKWNSFVFDTKHIKKIEITRPFQFSQSVTIELHGFSDASESGYAAVVYFRCQLLDNTTVVRQVISKTRVAPLKKITLPRLELCAAHLLGQIVAYCLNIFSPKFEFTSINLWCDSTIVLTWLQTPSYRLKTFVANRVAQTQELVPSHWWRHVRSNDNPADCASRGILPSHLIEHSLWWNGPSWLCLPQDKWPTSNFIPVNIEANDETKHNPLTVLVSSTVEEWDLLFKFSNWSKLERVTAYILRFINNCRPQPNAKLQGFLSSKELKRARTQIFKLVQASSFSENILLLKNNAVCTPSMRRLCPFLDAENVLRVGGRLNKAQLPYDSKHAVLLPKKHYVVDLYIDFCHKKHLHSGPQLTQSILSQEVWILSARSAIRSRIFKCVACFKNKPRNQTPLMADLPSARVIPARPFLSTGIDYGGPFTIKIHNMRSIRHVKIYICIMVCLVTKAVHIETVTDLTTEAFIAAFKRFVSRRGLCKDVYTDCGTNFIGANTELKNIVKLNLNSKAAQESLYDFAAPQGVDFHFNPPASPHKGGLWESAIKSAKYHLRRVIGDHVLTLTEFMTLTIQIEAMLNSRPLTPLSSDPNDCTALTPGHFLIGSPIVSIPEIDYSHIPPNRLKQWQLMQSIQQRIWKRWQMEYLHTLQERSKWTTPTTNLKVGDLVLVHNTTPSFTWPLARILEVFPGQDGIVRVVKLKTQTNILVRPVVKIFPLPID